MILLALNQEQILWHLEKLGYSFEAILNHQNTFFLFMKEKEHAFILILYRIYEVPCNLLDTSLLGLPRVEWSQSSYKLAYLSPFHHLMRTLKILLAKYLLTKILIAFFGLFSYLFGFPTTFVLYLHLLIPSILMKIVFFPRFFDW